MGREFQNCIERYSKSIFCCLPKSDEMKRFANDFRVRIKNIIFRDCPDGYIKYEDYILIIEHFEYDSTKNNRKGSETEIENARIDRNVIKSPSSYYSDKFNVHHSSISLKNNFIKQYSKHYSKIENYKKQLISEGIANDKTVFKTLFCCEDKTKIGNYDKNTGDCVSVLYLRECLDYVIQFNVDYLLMCEFFYNKYYTRLIDVSLNLSKLIPSKPARTVNLYDAKPRVTGFSTKIKL